jgi:LysR family transcriptional regulator, glycine cleavage system transcriptional activator
MHLSPSAISHAIRKLEDLLAAKLFERDARQVRLSPEGQTLMRHTTRAFEELRRGVEIISARNSQLLRLHCAPSFAAQCLAPRLSKFLAQNPGIEVRLAAGSEYARFDTDEFEVDIVYGVPRRDDLVTIPLAEETVLPLCAPGLARSIVTPEDLFDQTLLQSDNKRVRWPDWFAANGLKPPPPHGTRFDRSFLAIAAAADGLGIALESTWLAERELAAGRLVAPLRGVSQDIRYIGHHLVFPRTVQQRRTVRAFVDWLKKEFGLDLESSRND